MRKFYTITRYELENPIYSALEDSHHRPTSFPTIDEAVKYAENTLVEDCEFTVNEIEFSRKIVYSGKGKG